MKVRNVTVKMTLKRMEINKQDLECLIENLSLDRSVTNSLGLLVP